MQALASARTPERRDLWVSQFKAKRGRAPRILGIGNVANNGFRNAIALRQIGIECDVLCNDYFHIMGSPEWEMARFDVGELDQSRPIWSRISFEGAYTRPRWFAQGRLATAIDYLIAYREELPEAESLWQQMTEENENCLSSSRPPVILESDATEQEIEEAVFRLIALYEANRFARNDHLTFKELIDGYSYFLKSLPSLKRLFRSYDAAIGYSIDGFLPLIAAKRPLLAYEHGTLRAIPFEPGSRGKLCNIVYREADHVMISNCDTIQSARSLELKSYSWVPHAILESVDSPEEEISRRARLRSQFDSDFVIFHPSRQHWSEERDPNYDKGNDVLVRGFAEFLSVKPNARLVAVSWGMHVEKTKTLIEELGIADRVTWIKPVPIRAMRDYVGASDVLADQFTIGTWGGIMPIGLMLEKPVLIFIKDDVHRWSLPEMPPVLNAGTPEQVFECLKRLLHEDEAARLARQGRDWYERYHSLRVVSDRLLDGVIAGFERQKLKDTRAIEDETGFVIQERLRLQVLRQSQQIASLTARLDAHVEPAERRLAEIDRHVVTTERHLSEIDRHLVTTERRVKEIEFYNQQRSFREIIKGMIPKPVLDPMLRVWRAIHR